MNALRKNHSVVLVYPGQRETAGYSYQDDFPVGLLYIAKALQEIEISVSIHDARKTERKEYVVMNYEPVSQVEMFKERTNERQ